jgi:hypothetical protein
VADDALFTIAGQEFKVTSPGRVFYPVTGTTKLDVIGYYADVSVVMLPLVLGRPATRKRWPEGVQQASFFVKDLEPGTPPWLGRVQIRHGSGPKFYPVFDSPAALAWLGQVAALEWRLPGAFLGGGPGAVPASSPFVMDQAGDGRDISCRRGRRGCWGGGRCWGRCRQLHLDFLGHRPGHCGSARSTTRARWSDSGRAGALVPVTAPTPPRTRMWSSCRWGCSTGNVAWSARAR